MYDKRLFQMKIDVTVKSMSFKRLNDIMYVSVGESSKFCSCCTELIWTIFHLGFLFACKVLTAISVFLRYDLDILFLSFKPFSMA